MDSAQAIDNMIDKIISGDNTEAKEDFDSIISQKITSALDIKKQELAQSIYSKIETQPEENTVEDEESADADNPAV